MTATTANAGNATQCSGVGSTYEFGDIHDPGAYVCNWSGHLLRIPEDALEPGRSPVLEIRGKEPLKATKISDDPFVTLTKARMIASDLDMAVSF